jgi:hypothetical protein
LPTFTARFGRGSAGALRTCGQRRVRVRVAAALQRDPDRAVALACLTTVATREARRLEHAARRWAPLDTAGEPSAPSTTPGYEQPREALEVLAAMPQRQREVFALHVAGYSYGEIALSLLARPGPSTATSGTLAAPSAAGNPPGPLEQGANLPRLVPLIGMQPIVYEGPWSRA